MSDSITNLTHTKVGPFASRRSKEKIPVKQEVKPEISDHRGDRVELSAITKAAKKGDPLLTVEEQSHYLKLLKQMGGDQQKIAEIHYKLSHQGEDVYCKDQFDGVIDALMDEFFPDL
ncbi:MAG: hypothetical protein K0S07_1211 [Chlamydiales bacterium]|jgi:hypothetical protein|nr:hypothetical protein [Chlamydiales bacterium]